MTETNNTALCGIVIAGGGGHARAVAASLRATGKEIRGYLAPEECAGKMLGPWLGDDEQIGALTDKNLSIALGIGFVSENGIRVRRKLLDRIIPEFLCQVIHPTATIMDGVKLGAGTFIAAGAVVGVNSFLGRGVIVNTAATIDHDTIIGDNTHLATGSVVAGDVRIGSDVLVGAGAVIRQGITIGNSVIVGAGAVVLRDVESGKVVVGNPARCLRPFK